MNRRSFLGFAAAALCAPAIVTSKGFRSAWAPSPRSGLGLLIEAQRKLDHLAIDWGAGDDVMAYYTVLVHPDHEPMIRAALRGSEARFVPVEEYAALKPMQGEVGSILNLFGLPVRVATMSEVLAPTSEFLGTAKKSD